jgi:uncharacterized membrane protein YfhO
MKTLLSSQNQYKNMADCKERIALKDLEDVQASDRIIETIAITTAMATALLFITETIRFRSGIIFLLISSIILIAKNRQYEKLEKEIKQEIKDGNL